MIAGFHPAAKLEYEAALAWLAREAGAQAAEELATEFWHAIDLLKRSPQLGVPAPRLTRKLTLRRFRYSIIYRAGHDSIRVLALAHHHRRPDYWSQRR